MKELMAAVGAAALPTFMISVLIFGFAPGFVLRLIVLIYPKTDPRRRELVAELYVMKRIERPVWVAEQIETALFEGLLARIRSHRSMRADLRFQRADRAISNTSATFVGVAILVIAGLGSICLFGILTLGVYLLKHGVSPDVAELTIMFGPLAYFFYSIYQAIRILDIKRLMRLARQGGDEGGRKARASER